MFRVTRPNLNLLVKPRFFLKVCRGKTKLYAIWKAFRLSKCIKLYFFPRKKKIKIICVPTLPKIFRPVTRNTHLFIWPKQKLIKMYHICCFKSYHEHFHLINRYCHVRPIWAKLLWKEMLSVSQMIILIFVFKKSSAFNICFIYSSAHIRLDFITERQTHATQSACFLRRSLIGLYILCNMYYLRT